MTLAVFITQLPGEALITPTSSGVVLQVKKAALDSGESRLTRDHRHRTGVEAATDAWKFCFGLRF